MDSILKKESKFWGILRRGGRNWFNSKVSTAKKGKVKTTKLWNNCAFVIQREMALHYLTKCSGRGGERWRLCRQALGLLPTRGTIFSERWDCKASVLHLAFTTAWIGPPSRFLICVMERYFAALRYSKACKWRQHFRSFNFWRQENIQLMTKVSIYNLFNGGASVSKPVQNSLKAPA